MSVTFLFDSAVTAIEVAFQLRGIHDGCNSVEFDLEFEELDISAIKFVVDSLEGDFCPEKTFCFCKSILMNPTIEASKITATCGTKIKFSPNISDELTFEALTNEQLQAAFATTRSGKSIMISLIVESWLNE